MGHILKEGGCEKTHQVHDFIREGYLGKTVLLMGECVRTNVVGPCTQRNKHRDFGRNLTLKRGDRMVLKEQALLYFKSLHVKEILTKRITLSIDTT